MKNAVIYLVLAAGAGVLLYTLFRKKSVAGSPSEGTADSKINTASYFDRFGNRFC